MTRLQKTLVSGSPEETAELARRVGARLTPGDTVLLSGPIGAGKTHFVRSLIHSVLDFPEDVPSPTFTLVQTYDTPHGEVWHADLYRVGSVDEVVELGLTDAFDTGICLVEWPDRLGDLAPGDALFIHMEPGATDPDRRLFHIRSSNPKWAEFAVPDTDE